ncbi:MAG: hypothetical protein F7C81_02385 [Desulfurococcales archaeon]|nr:hypothetical protein [Desulfurococcales archaeon]
MIRDKPLLLAERLATSAIRIMGIHDYRFEVRDFREPSYNPLAWTIEQVLEARKEYQGDSVRRIGNVIAWLTSILPDVEVSKSIPMNIEVQVHEAAKKAAKGLTALAGAVRDYLTAPTLKRLIYATAVIALEASRGCSIEPRLRSRRDRLESIMLKLGLIIGLLFSIFFIISIVYAANLVLALLMIAAMGFLWIAVRRIGVEYALLNIEISWRECRMTRREVASIIESPPAPELTALKELISKSS